MTAPTGWPVDQALRTARLMLEPLRVEHADELAPVLDEPALHTYIGGQPATAAELRERYARQVVGRSSDGSQLWFNWVLREEDTGQALGYLQASVLTEHNAPVAEVAWVLGVPSQGRGFASEAALEVVRWLLERGSTVIIAHIHPEHRASIGVAKAIGMSPTATVVDGEVRWESAGETGGRQ